MSNYDEILVLEAETGVHWFWYLFWLVAFFPAIVVLWVVGYNKREAIKRRNVIRQDANRAMHIASLAPAAPKVSKEEELHRRNLETITALKG